MAAYTQLIDGLFECVRLCEGERVCAHTVNVLLLAHIFHRPKANIHRETEYTQNTIPPERGKQCVEYSNGTNNNTKSMYF